MPLDSFIKKFKQNTNIFIDGLAKRGAQFSGISERAAEISSQIDLLHRRRIARDSLAAFHKQLSRIFVENNEKKLKQYIDDYLAGVSSVIGQSAAENLRNAEKACSPKAFFNEVSATQKNIEAMIESNERALMDYWSQIPNIPDNSVPEGVNANDNLEIHTAGSAVRSADQVTMKNGLRTHDELGIALKIMDFEQAAEISGSRFVILKGLGAKLERAVGAFMLDNAVEHGYVEISPPLLALQSAFFGVGQLPKFGDDLYLIDNQIQLSKQLTEDELHKQYRSSGPALISTAEVVLTNMVANKILLHEELPLRYTACTPCFRKEAGSAGKDTKGIIRLHQFMKVELVSIVDEESSWQEHERMTKIAELVLEKLELPYRRMLLCTGDLGFASAKTYDLEVWMPSQNCYREISSCSNCTDFQSIRMNSRYKNAQDRKNKFVHTLNASALAVGRTVAAILENCQKSDGHVELPKVLVPYMGGIKEI